MRKAVVLVLVLVYAVGAFLSEPSKPYAPSIEIEMEHTHEVTEGHHHHHDFENDGGHDDTHSSSHEHDEQAEHKHPVPHSHESSVAMANACILSPYFVSDVLIPSDAKVLWIPIYKDSPPKDISLTALFRPPIV